MTQHDLEARTGGATAPGGAAGPEGTSVRTEVLGQVGVITLDDEPRRNALNAQIANGIIAALEGLRAEGARAVVLRAAAGLHVWSAGQDIDELPRGGRDPLGYNDHLEQLLRSIRTFPAPVIAMVHGSVWGGAFDLVLSCDVLIADETATFAITPANLGLPYNTAGLLHFLGRLPINLTKEMFFTATPIDAQTAKEWLVLNHLGGVGRARDRHPRSGRDDGVQVASGHSGHQGTAPRSYGLPAHRGACVRTHPGTATRGLRQQRLSRRPAGLRRETKADLPGKLTRPPQTASTSGGRRLHFVELIRRTASGGCSRHAPARTDLACNSGSTLPGLVPRCVLHAAKRPLLVVLRAVGFLLAHGKAAELLVLWEASEVFLPGREASDLCVLIELLRISLALGKPSAGHPVGTGRVFALSLVSHVCLHSYVKMLNT